MTRFPVSRFFLTVLIVTVIAAGYVRSQTVQPQRPGTVIRGIVHDGSTNLPMQGTYLLLHRSGDSTLVTGAASDRKGAFELSNVIPGNYYLVVSCIGYTQRILQGIRADSLRPQIDLGMIEMSPSAVQMKTVEVSADQPSTGELFDRMVYKADDDLVANASSAADLLQNIPSLDVDEDGAVTLRGSDSPLILIDGKPAPVMEGEGNSYLEDLPASAVERVEVMTNPSAQFSSQGKGGIVNIVLKKNAARGLTGNASANAGVRERFNGQLRLGFNPGPYNATGSYLVRRTLRDRTYTDDRIEHARNDPSPSSTALYQDILRSYGHPLAQRGSLGLELTPASTTTLTGTGEWYQTRLARNDESDRQLRAVTGFLLTDYDRNSAGVQFDRQYALTTGFQQALDSNGSMVHAEYFRSRAMREGSGAFHNLFILPRIPERSDSSAQDEDYRNDRFSVDGAARPSTGLELAAGYRGDWNNADLAFSASAFDTGSGQYLPDSIKSSLFLLRRNIQAGYLSLKYGAGKLGVSLGLRIERMVQDLVMTDLDSTLNRVDVAGYPSIQFSYRAAPFTELRLGYSRRVVWPVARDLNPFAEYRDPRNLTFGTPTLAPERVHAFEFGVRWHRDKLSLQPTLFYRRSTNTLTGIKTLRNRTTLVTTRQNLSAAETAGMELSASIGSWSFASLQTNLTGYYETLDTTTTGAGQTRNGYAGSGSFMVNLNPYKGGRFQVNYRFTTSRSTPQGSYYPSGAVGFGFRQNFLGTKVMLNVSVNDIFGMNKREYELDIPRLHQHDIHEWESRFVYVGITYRFGIRGSAGSAGAVPDAGEGDGD